VKRGWIPTGSFNTPEVQESCRNEDNFAYKCILKRDIPEKNIQGAVDYILYRLNDTATDEDRKIVKMEGKDLHDHAANLIQAFFEEYKGEGVTVRQHYTVCKHVVTTCAYFYTFLLCSVILVALPCW
jgi:hypothetical protein